MNEAQNKAMQSLPGNRDETLTMLTEQVPMTPTEISVYCANSAMIDNIISAYEYGKRTSTPGQPMTNPYKSLSVEGIAFTKGWFAARGF